VVLEGETERKLEELPELRSHELGALLSPSPLSVEEADTIIMAARAHWFPDDNPAGEGGDAVEAPEDEKTEAETVEAETLEAEPAKAKKAPAKAKKAEGDAE